MPLSSAALQALRTLVRVLGPDGSFVIVGATVPLVLLDVEGRRGGSRETRDVDAVIRAATWEEFGTLKQRLIGLGFREGEAPQRLYFGEAELDLIPYGPTIVATGRLQWAGEDRAMSTLGLEEAFACAQPVPLAEDLVLPMVSLAGCVLLKLIAYRDRPAERARDLLDIVSRPDSVDTDILAWELEDCRRHGCGSWR